MSTTLTNGLKLPDKGSVDWYADMQSNYTILDGAVGTVAEHTTALSGKAPLVHTHTKSDITDLFNSANEWTGKNVYSGDSLPTLRVKNTSLDISSLPATNLGMHIDYLDKNNIVVSGWNYIKGPDGTTRLYVELATKDSNNQEIRRTLRFDTDQNGTNWQFYPSADTNLGTASNQWKSVYAQSYYYNGIAWGLDKANEWSADQTITSNRFLRVYGYRFQVKNAGMELGTVPSSNQWTGMNFVDKNNTPISEIVQSYQSSGNLLYQINIWPNEANSEKRSVIAYTYNSASNVNALSLTSNLLPIGSNLYNLGISNQKWKTLNGINPGALSLPDLSDADPVDTRSWVVSTPTNNTYTPSENGWLNVVVADSSPSANEFSLYVKSTNFFASAVHKLADIDDSKGKVGLFIPVTAGITYYVVVKGNVPNITISATLYPCFGSV